MPFHVIINPSITSKDHADVEFFQGCLSLAGFTAIVARARKVRGECLDHNWEQKIIEASGWYARILQHEIDHLHGTLYIDRMLTRTFSGMENFNRYWKDRSIAQAKKLASIKG